MPNQRAPAGWESSRITGDGAWTFTVEAAVGGVVALIILAGWWVAVFKGESVGVLKKCMSRGWRYTSRGGRQGVVVERKGEHRAVSEDLRRRVQ